MRPLVLLCLSVVLVSNVLAQRYRTILDKIQQDPDYSAFYDLIRNNGMVKRDLLYQPITVFAPELQAFDQYEGDAYADLALYHMTFEVKTLTLLRTGFLPSVNSSHPPLWVTRVDDDIYINSAMVLKDKSNYVTRNRTGEMGQPQVLHMIDRVLDPILRARGVSPSAYDFIISTTQWNLGNTNKFTKFHQKIHENNLLRLYKKENPHTFFIPIDSGIDPSMYHLIDKKIILRHIVPNQVLFIRPSVGITVTMHESIFSYTLSVEQVNDSFFVKSTPIDATHDLEELDFTAEILVPDIPVKNGVVHLISRPLGNFKKALKPFPSLPVMQKISGDPELNVIYKMGTDTKFNSKLEKDKFVYTYFVSIDSSWTKIAGLGLEPSESFDDILARHLVISEAPYTMQELARLTKLNNYTDIVLRSELGDLRISVMQIEGTYFIKWNNKYIKVLRPDYECTNGYVHVLNGPLANFRKTDVISSNPRDISLVNYLNMLQRMLI